MQRLIVAPPPQFSGTTTGGLLVGGFGVLVGWAFRESTGAAPAAFTLNDATGPTGGAVLVPFSLQASESTRDFLPWHSVIPFDSGLSVVVTAGTIDATLYVIPGERLDLVRQVFTELGTVMMGDAE